MKTNDLITELCGDLKNPSESKNWFVRYWSIWTLFAFILTALTYGISVLTPQEAHLPDNLGSPVFKMEVLIWLGIAILASTVAYLSSVPHKTNVFIIPGAYVAMAALAASVAIRFDYSHMVQDFGAELYIGRAGCGMFIATSAAISTWALFAVMRRAAAPLHVQKTATWAALSLGAFSAMLMHTVCIHVSSAHVILWHALPMSLVILWARFSSKTLLRW